MAMSYATRPSDGMGDALWWLGIVLLVIVAFRRSRGRKGGLNIGLFTLGLMLCVARMVGWGLEDAEAWIGVGLVLAASLFGWVSGKLDFDKGEA